MIPEASEPARPTGDILHISRKPNRDGGLGVGASTRVTATGTSDSDSTAEEITNSPYPVESGTARSSWPATCAT